MAGALVGGKTKTHTNSCYLSTRSPLSRYFSSTGSLLHCCRLCVIGAIFDDRQLLSTAIMMMVVLMMVTYMAQGTGLSVDQLPVQQDPSVMIGNSWAHLVRKCCRSSSLYALGGHRPNNLNLHGSGYRTQCRSSSMFGPLPQSVGSVLCNT